MANVISPPAARPDNSFEAIAIMDAESVLRDIIAAHPAATEVFERYAIEFCCSGCDTLADACQAVGVRTEAVLADLRQLETDVSAGQATHWERASLRQLTGFICHHHHEYTRRAIQEIRALAPQAEAAQGREHPELRKIATIFGRLAAEMLFHLAKEEHGLFPRIERLESVSRGQTLAIAAAALSREEATIRVMMEDHGASGAMMKEIRDLSGDFTPPPGADAALRRWYRELAEFERDLHRHVHLENNILFPRALQLETDVLGRPKAMIAPLA
ncbi:MAG: DUF542 domain-containing protein [Terriglobales bacterium]